MQKSVIIICLLMLVACQPHNSGRKNYQSFIDAEQLTEKSRVQQFRFQGWQPLDERHLILRSSQNRSYLVTLLSSCNELPFAQNIKLKQEFATILNSRFDSIIVPGQINQECTIKSLHELDKQQRKLLVEFSEQPDEIR